MSTVAGGLLAAPLAAEAQSASKTARIGFLSLSSGPTPTMDISPGLRELGWIEGQNIAVEYRWAAGREDQLPALAAELVRLKVDVILTSSGLAAQAAKRATATIPIVATFVAEDDVWVTPLTSGRAWRLSADDMPASHPRFSPDGRWGGVDQSPRR